MRAGRNHRADAAARRTASNVARSDPYRRPIHLPRSRSMARRRAHRADAAARRTASNVARRDSCSRLILPPNPREIGWFAILNVGRSEFCT